MIIIKAVMIKIAYDSIAVIRIMIKVGMMIEK